MDVVTILVATYNGRSFICEQLDSLLLQDYSNIKIRLLDDCSTDGTWEMLQEKYGDVNRVEIYKNASNLGVVKTFERLLEMVDTEYFCLCDQDDIWLPNKVSGTLKHLMNTDVELVYSDLVMVNANLSVIHPSKWQFSNSPPITGVDPVPFIIKNPVTGCTILANKSVLQKALPFPAGIPMHDRWLAVVAAFGKGVDAYPVATMLYRQHGGNEVGGMPYGLSGLIARVKKDGKNNLFKYLKNRAVRRVAMIDALADIGCKSYELSFLAKYYQSGWFYRMLYSWRYLNTIQSHAKTLGAKNIASDFLMTLIPY